MVYIPARLSELKTLAWISILIDHSIAFRFNPVAPTLLKRALHSLISKLRNHTSQSTDTVDKVTIDRIVENSNGDMRNAVMAMEFILRCPQSNSGLSKGKEKKRRKTEGTGPLNRRAATLNSGGMSSTAQREQYLALFHLLGKVFYNKRLWCFSLSYQSAILIIRLGKGDSRPTYMSQKDVQKEEEIDSRLKDLPPPPLWLKDEERRRSRVDVEVRSSGPFISLN